MTLNNSFDVVVVGGGNAALCAALSAREAGASVLLIERAPESERGGNSSFAGGNWRVVYRGVDDIKKLAPDLTDEEIANSEFGSYTEENFFDDMARVTQFRTHPDLCEVLVTRCLDTLTWMRTKGVRFMLSYGRQAFKINGKFRFWGGMIFTVSGGGLGVVDALFSTAQRDGVEISYDSRADRLLCDECPPKLLSSRAAASRRIPNGAHDTWDADGTSPKYAAAASIPGMASGWPWTQAPNLMETGRDATR